MTLVNSAFLCILNALLDFNHNRYRQWGRLLQNVGGRRGRSHSHSQEVNQFGADSHGLPFDFVKRDPFPQVLFPHRWHQF